MDDTSISFGDVGGPPPQMQQQQQGLDFYPTDFGPPGGVPAGGGGGGVPMPVMDPGAGPSGMMAPQPSSLSTSGSLGGYGSFEDEPPLLEELGINFEHIKAKTLSVLHPTQSLEPHIMDDSDLAGPLLFCLLFGSFLLASGKIHFGYIYGVAAMGCASLYAVLNLMADKPITFSGTASVLGYSLLPMVALSSIAVLLSLHGIIGAVLALASVFWCTVSASKMFVAALMMEDQRLLIAYPCMLLYGVFALLAVF